MRNFLMVSIASVIMGAALNLFLVPHSLIMGGISGIGMILGEIFNSNTGWIIFLLNVPVFILGFFQLGKKFVALSMYSVFLTSLSMQYIPIEQISDDIILSAVFGGVIVGISVGLIIKSGGSTGGFDIIGLIIAKKIDYPLGKLFIVLNAIVVVISGFFINWEIALYGVVIIYISGKTLDVIHTNHIKLTLTIVTQKGQLLQEALIQNCQRGITVLDGKGAYSNEEKNVLIMVISNYELSEVKKLIKKTDEKAFVNINETVGVLGLFRTN